MNEDYQVESAEMSDSADVTTEADLSAFDDAWDDDGFTTSDDADMDMDETTDNAQEADQQTESGPETDNKSADKAAATVETSGEEKAQGEADQLFTLKHLDETREVDRNEVISLAQKGMDYDRKVGKLTSELAEYKGFFEELAKNSGLTNEQFMDSVRAKLLVQAEKNAGRQISEADAVFRVQQARANKAKAAQEAAEQQAKAAKEEAKRKSDEEIKAFVAAFPGVKVSDIPQDVWNDVQKNGDLMGAYTRHISAQTAKENAELKKKLEALENNAKNAARSTGSRKTAGSSKILDPFDEPWDD